LKRVEPDTTRRPDFICDRTKCTMMTETTSTARSTTTGDTITDSVAVTDPPAHPAPREWSRRLSVATGNLLTVAESPVDMATIGRHMVTGRLLITIPIVVAARIKCHFSCSTSRFVHL